MVLHLIQSPRRRRTDLTAGNNVHAIADAADACRAFPRGRFDAGGRGRLNFRTGAA
jgi:hypothetical protein